VDEVLAERIWLMRMERGLSWKAIAFEVEGVEKRKVGRDLFFKAAEVLGVYLFSDQGD
jgi:hypothetical protein